MLIKGDYGEGGGSIVRLAVGLSVLTGKSIRIVKIRANRKNPGLRAQHLAGVKAAAELCGGSSHCEIGSTELDFKPSDKFKDFLEVEVPTAGSIGLVLQTLQIACLKARKPVEVIIKGGATFGLWAPPIPYLQRVTFPILKRIGYKINCHVERHGFYPKGGGRVKVIFRPGKLEPLNLKRNGDKIVNAFSVASRALGKRRVAERMVEGVEKVLSDYIVNVEKYYVPSDSPGCGLVLWHQSGNCILGSDAIGELKVRSEELGEKAAKDLLSVIKSDATVDPYLSDQLIPFLAIAGGEIRGEVTNHTKTNIWLVKQFLDCDFKVEEGRIKVTRSTK